MLRKIIRLTYKKIKGIPLGPCPSPSPPTVGRHRFKTESLKDQDKTKKAEIGLKTGLDSSQLSLSCLRLDPSKRLDSSSTTLVQWCRSHWRLVWSAEAMRRPFWNHHAVETRPWESLSSGGALALRMQNLQHGQNCAITISQNTQPICQNCMKILNCSKMCVVLILYQLNY